VLFISDKFRSDDVSKSSLEGSNTHLCCREGNSVEVLKSYKPRREKLGITEKQLKTQLVIQRKTSTMRRSQNGKHARVSRISEPSLKTKVLKDHRPGKERAAGVEYVGEGESEMMNIHKRKGKRKRNAQNKL